MLFGRKNCSECGSNYDIVEATCPACGHENDEFIARGISKTVIWLPIYTQILLFVIGWAGLMALGVIVELIIIYVPNTLRDVDKLMLINTIRYLGVAMGMTGLLIPHLKKFKLHFSKAKPYLLGLAGGAALIAAQIIINIVIQAIRPTPENANQTAVENFISYYPLLSILVIGILGPVIEELTYRLGLFTFLKRANKILAYILTVLIFALIHFDFFAGSAEAYITELLNLPSYIAAGFLLCLWYDKFGLASSIVAHSFNNLYSIIMPLIILLARKYGYNI